MGRTKHTSKHVPQRALTEDHKPYPRATNSAQDEHPADAPDSIWRSRLIEYFSLLDEWSKKARRNEP